MLTQLYIENIAVIEKVTIQFDRGLNVLTGETGAGKSMIIDAIHGILGERMSRDLVRHGAKSAFVSAVFDTLNPSATKALEENGYEPEEDGSLLVQRTISADGKSVCKINGRPATVSVLKAIVPLLLNIHGQHESYQLLSPNLHMNYIDKMGELEALKQQYQNAYREMRQIRAELKHLQMDEAEKQERIEFLRYRVDELEKANLQPGERQALTEKKNQYLHCEKIALALNTAKEILGGGDDFDGVTAMLGTAADTLEDAQPYLQALAPLTEKMRDFTYELQDLQESLREFLADTEYDPGEMEQIEQRLDLLHRLSRKYGETEEEMLESLRQMEEELSAIETAEERVGQLTQSYETAKGGAIELARQLSQARADAAGKFSQQVKEQLQFLNMPGIQFAVSQERVPLNAMGCDQMEFLIAANPGEDPKPISKIASGGELSRIMLSIKTVLSGNDEIDTLIFDEVDTGISGATAEKVGRKLREVAKSRQVLCVTHLAQIAALGTSHYRIEKEVLDGRTYTRVEKLDENGRKRELARIMGGSEITDLMLQNAEALLEAGASLEE